MGFVVVLCLCCYGIYVENHDDDGCWSNYNDYDSVASKISRTGVCLVIIVARKCPGTYLNITARGVFSISVQVTSISVCVNVDVCICGDCGGHGAY